MDAVNTIAVGIVNLHVYCDKEICDRDFKESVCDGWGVSTGDLGLDDSLEGVGGSVTMVNM